MGQSYFIWKDKDCRGMGVRLKSPLPIIRPEERVEHIEIPGRPGDLTQTQGPDVYNSYIHTASISVQDGINVRNVYDWLRGEGYLISSSEPDRRQRARVIGAITLDKISKNLDIYTGDVQFYCQPLKELLWEPTVTISAAGIVVNSGDVACKPLYKITPSGATVVLTVSRTVGAETEVQSLTVTGCTSGTVIWVDADSMEIWNSTQTALLTKNGSGGFPILHPGDNSVGGSGWSAIEIRKRERYL